jgi:hypothetical protein
MLKTMYQKLLLVVALIVFAIPAYAQNLINLTITPNQVVGGNNASATVEIDAPAPVGGFLVNLDSLNPSVASMPADVRIPEGSRTATFTVSTNSVSTAQSAHLWAYVNYDPKTALIRPIFVTPSGYTGTTMEMVISSRT